MPYVSEEPQGSNESLGSCSRCKTESAVLLSRKEAFCRVCFIRFISGKQRRHMSGDKYKVKFGENITRDKVVMPLSLGPSSLVLLDILLTQFNEQLKNPRVQLGFELHALFIDDSSVNAYKNEAEELIESIKSTYHTERFPFLITVVDLNKFALGQRTITRLRLDPQFNFHVSTSLPTDVDGHTVADILKSCPNRASRQDLQQIIMTHIINEYTHSIGATSILFGHNMSSLAEQVLSLTVKGRGSEIHTHLTDGAQTINGIEVDIIHPLRDVSQGEIDNFIRLRSLEKFILHPVIDTTKIMNKQKTINEVVSNYYKDVDTADANIVSTVVKTGAKLAQPKTFQGKLCTVCGGKIYNRPMEWLRSITYHGQRGPESELEEELLKEWMDHNGTPQIEPSSDSTGPVQEIQGDICYGCAVTVGGHPQGTIQWPLDIKQSILDEFVIGEDEDEDDS